MKERNPRPQAVPRTAAVSLVVIVCLSMATVHLWRVNRSLQASSTILRQDARTARETEDKLRQQLAAKNADLRRAEADVEMLRFRVDAVELQLDGVDKLSRQVREALQLPPNAGTWAGTPADATPRGGSGTSPLSRDRVDLTQVRLLSGAMELRGLLDAARRSPSEADAVAAAQRAAPVGAPPANWPVRGPVTSRFGWRIFHARPDYHSGIDIAVPYGTPVQATGVGTVVGSGWQPGYGWSVLVHHGGGYSTLYAHLSQLLVQVGDTVTPGAPVARSGSSGNSTGPHVHYEIWQDGRPVDPRPFMDGNGSGN